MFAALSCTHKKTESIHPIAIDVWKPYNNQSFRMIDTMPILASFRSQLDINAASIKILDENRANLGNVLQENPQNTYLEVDIKAPIAELGFIKGGNYYLQFSGSNAETTTNYY